jgi:hypothetical protein
MPVVVNNDFSKDTYGMKSEMLNAIQAEFAAIQSELAAPANIETWAEDCLAIYTKLE